MNKKYITFVIFLMFMSFAVFPVESASVTYTCDFEGGTVGQEFSNSHYATDGEESTFVTHEFEVDNTPVRTGTRSFKISAPSHLEHDHAVGWINLTYDDTNNQMIDWVMYWYFDYGSDHEDALINFQFRDGGSCVIYMRLYEGSSNAHIQPQYSNHNHGWDNLGSEMLADNDWHKWGFSFFGNDTVEYYMDDTTVTDTPYGIREVPAIDRVMVDWEEWGYGSDFGNFHLDDIHFNVSDSGEYQGDGEESNPCVYDYMTDRYSYIGELDTYCTFDVLKPTIETRYNIPCDMNVTGVDLAVSTDQYDDDPTKSHYTLYFNGISLGSPDCFLEKSYYYILRWIFNADLDSEVPIIEFKHSQKTSGGRYWNVVTGCYSGDDLDDDGEINFRESTTPDGAYNGKIWNWDIAYQMYYEDIQFPDDETYFDNDFIYVINETHYCGKPVWLTYTLSSMGSDTYVRIWNDDTSVEVNDETYPYTCPSTSETLGFITSVSANYTAKLYRNSVELDADSFYVNDFFDPNNYVYTTPNPSLEGTSYLVKYAFDNAEGYDGAIFLSNTPDYKNYYEIHYIFDGNSGSYAQSINAPCTLYYIMMINKNGTYYVVDDGIHQHMVKAESLKNYFTLGESNLVLEDGECTQSIHVETTHMGGNCRFYDNGKLIFTITESPHTEYYTVTTAGNHKVEMRLITNETIFLQNETYTVSGEQEDEYIEDTSFILKDWVYDSYGDFGVFITGVCVVLGFMFIPFALVLGVNVKYGKNIALGDLHWSIYLIFAIVGVIVDVQLHLAELWIILLICVVSIAITVLSWNSRR